MKKPALLLSLRPALLLGSIFLTMLMTPNVSAYQQVFTEDVIVQGSLATGFDALAGEVFGEDTIRLKENNLRIHFDDTSSSSSFPRNDWRISVNSALDGGGDFFRIEDTTNAVNPFTVFANAPNDAFTVAPGGIGIGTASPISALHVLADGNGDLTSATIRGEVTNGLAAQDRIMLDMRNNGAVIMNLLDTSVSGAMPYQVRAASDRLSFQQFGGNRAGFSIFEDGAIRFVANGIPNLTVTGNGNLNVIGQAGGGNLNVIGPTGGAGNLFVKGNIVYNGTLTGPSDRNIKENFRPIDSQEILAKVVRLPITKWNYIADKNDTPHLGPMAQDFYAAFGLGNDDRRISLMDNTAVALAAIQGLNQVVKSKDDEIAMLKQSLQAQSKRISESAEIISELTTRLERLESLVAPTEK